MLHQTQCLKMAVCLNTSTDDSQNTRARMCQVLQQITPIIHTHIVLSCPHYYTTQMILIFRPVYTAQPIWLSTKFQCHHFGIFTMLWIFKTEIFKFQYYYCYQYFFFTATALILNINLFVKISTWSQSKDTQPYPTYDHKSNPLPSEPPIQHRYISLCKQTEWQPPSQENTSALLLNYCTVMWKLQYTNTQQYAGP